MEDLNVKYMISTYEELAELSKGKVYLVKSSLDNKIYIKKILQAKNQNIYEKIKELSIANIPMIYEILNLGDKLIVIEEYINGNSLEEILEKSKTISPNKVVDYILDLIEIVGKIHCCKPPIIHKDINPSNIMISNDGLLKLIDFDISRMHCHSKNTDTHILGTYGYAAPEHFGFNQTDARSDIYSIGVTMNVMLVGKLPNEEKYLGRLSKIIDKCTEMDPNKRYQDVNELKTELLRISKSYNKQDNIRLDTRLPGFKSDNIILKIFASFWYLLLLMIALGFFYEEPIGDGRILDIKMSLFFLALTLFYGNCNDIKSKLPILNSKKPLKKILGYIIYTALLFTILGMGITP